MSMSIRRAGSADAPVIVEFNRLLALESEGKMLDLALLTPGVSRGLSDLNRALYFVAEEGGAILGQMMITFEWSDWRNGFIWWIQSVYVRADARRRGVFRSLFDHVRCLAVDDPNVVALRLYVEKENHVAQEVYRKLGMEKTGYFVLEKYPV